jgi:ABC-type multidrug transport system ATPase subunit
MLRRIELTNFKAFERFTVLLRGDAFLVGPNNAGKSTLIAALRAGANMLRIANRLRAMDSREVDLSIRQGHAFSAEQIGLVQENLRHEFHQVETRMRLVFDAGAELIAVWPAGDDSNGFFFVRDKDKTLRRPIEVREAFPTVGLIPVLSPVEHDEDVLSDSHVRANLDGRLASRHFRNQLYRLQLDFDEKGKTAYEAFCAFAQPWLTELDLGELEMSSVGGASLDLIYHEVGSNKPKEVSWLGDGMQIWLQLLLHVFRLRDSDVIVLDEPDIFLHSDLQRRLVDLLESITAQAITATHSPEVLAEADPDAIVWISRNRRKAVTAPEERVLAGLSQTLGTQFNLRLARTLRIRCALFVEGKDAKLLRILAETLGATNVAREDGLAVISLEGVDRAEHLEAFSWLVDDLLGNSVKTFVVLDRDYRDKTAVSNIEKQLAKSGILPHVWRRHELENYLLDTSAIARVSGAEEDWVRDQLRELASGFEDEVYSGIAADFDRRLRRTGVDSKSVAKQAKQAADARWADQDRRFEICPGKELLSALNARLGDEGHKPVRARQLAKTLTEAEIPAELRKVVRDVDDAC